MVSFRTIYLDNPLVPGRILDIFETKHPQQDIALFFVHGGGWTGGSRTIFHSIAIAFHELGFEVASTDYRLGKVTLFEQAQDVRDALRVFAADLKRRNRTTSIVLIGSSAGAHLAQLAALQPQKEPPYQIAGICVQAAPFTFEPWTDIFPAIWQAMQRAVGASYESCPELYREASPLHHVTATTPPIFVLHAENEHMFPLSLTKEFAQRVRAYGTRVILKIYPRAEHGFFYSLDRWQQKEAFQDILDFAQGLSPASH